MIKIQFPIGAAIALGLGLVSSSSAIAQSLVRISGEGGRQMKYGMQPEAISSDGRHLLVSGLDGLFAGDNNGFLDVTWFDLWTGVHQRAISGAGGVATNGDTLLCGLSANERYLVCSSDATNLLPGDTNAALDVYMLDQQTGTISRASFASNGAQPTLDCFARSVSNDGRFVVFESDDDALVPGDGNFNSDVFVRDMLSNTTELISVTPGGTSGDGYADNGHISSDGRYVAFTSGSTDLVSGDTNGAQDIFVRDRQLLTTARVSVSAAGVQSNNESYEACMTPDAHWIAFASAATNLAPGSNGLGSVYLVDRTTGQVTNVSRSSTGQVSDGFCGNPEMSPDGRFVTFQSTATNLDPADTDGGQPDNFIRDLQLGTTRMVSIATNGSQGSTPATGFQSANVPMPTPDGQRVFFNANLAGLVAGDTNNDSDAFLWDRASTVPAITSYCAGKLNSAGCVPSISSSGEPHSSGPTDAFFLSAGGLTGNSLGLFLWSGLPAATPFSGGTLCLGTPVHRTSAQNSGGLPPSGCNGSYSYHFTRAYMSTWNLQPGNVLFGQYWGRDNGLAPPNNVALSDAITFTVWP